MYPKLKFRLNKNLDKEICKDFLYLSTGGLDFGKEILKIHPKLKSARLIKDKKEREKEIDRYIDHYYKTYEVGLLRKKESFRRLWEDVKEGFFDRIGIVFKNHSWPKGKYICYLSIFPCGPRFLENKTFQSFYKYPKKILIQQIIHEMLHFIFFDYLQKHYPKYLSKKNYQIIWKISEALNYIIQNQKEWRRLHGKPILAYPKIKKLIQKMQTIWQEKQDIDYLLKKLLPK